jgi:uncharacterized cupredoxin-like copper-binding protein
MTFVRYRTCLLMAAGLAMACRSDKPVTDQAANSSATPAAPVAAPAATTAATPASAQLVHVKAADFKFDLPANVPAGPVTFHLMNDGKEMHHAIVVRLEEGKTLKDLAEAMKTEGPPPPWLKFVGGPNGAVPGATASSTLMLTPGRYAVLCLIPGTDGVPHFAKGMAQEFTVTGSASQAALPAATDTIHLKDYGFQSARPISAGNHSILVVNDGPQVHEMVMLKLMPGKSVEDFGDWATTGGMKGPPPALPIGGAGLMEPGTSSLVSADLTPGDYGYICFVPDAKDGKPHVAHGMVRQFTVQ